MNVSRKQAAENRQQIVKAASRLFCEAGLAGVGVAEITRAAGLTHGGFYRQFDSKEALFAEAAELALRDSAANLAKSFGRPNWFSRYGETYLGDDYVYGVRGNCPVALLSVDASRQSSQVQAAFARGLRAFLTAGREVEVGSNEWREATAGLAMMIGTLLMARSVKDGDPELSAAILDSGRHAVGNS